MNIKCAHSAIVELHKLIPNPLNPNKHPQKQIDLLAKIISHQGQRAPIVVSKRSGFITKGHGRLAAIQQLGWDSAAVDFQDYETEADEYADMVADNKIAELAEHDNAKMIEDLTKFEWKDDFDFDLLGIPDFKPPEKFEPQSDEDEVPSAGSYNERCKPGDIWQLGRHRLMCGDSTNIQHVEALMAGEKADMVFTDPPYGMDLNTDYAITSRVVGKTYRPVIGDDKDFDPRFFFEYFKDAREHFWWGADYYCEHIPKGGAWIVWDKKKEDLDESIGTGLELCWSRQPHKRMMARFLWSGFTAKERNEARAHPTQKPIALAEWFFERWGKPEDSVLDLFGGSGSTLIACEKTGRNCYMMEIDPHYCNVILARWEKYTGLTAELVSG